MGSAMLAWGEARLRAIAAGHDTDQPRWLGQETWDTDKSAGTFLAANGYRRVRTFYEMVRPTLDEVPDPEVPIGFVTKPVGPGRHPNGVGS